MCWRHMEIIFAAVDCSGKNCKIKILNANKRRFAVCCDIFEKEVLLPKCTCEMEAIKGFVKALSPQIKKTDGRNICCRGFRLVYFRFYKGMIHSPMSKLL